MHILAPVDGMNGGWYGNRTNKKLIRHSVRQATRPVNSKAYIMRLILVLALAIACNPGRLEAQQAVEPALGARNPSRQAKQAWLYERLVAPVQNPQLVNAYTEKLRNMSDGQLDASIASYQAQLLYRQKLLQQQRWRNNAAVGFRPIVTWLPTGTNFTAGAIVSPDRRYVRMSLSPFFSSIPRVDTFNYRTGQSRNIYNATPNYMQTQAPSTPQVRPGNSWYKKIRTLR